MTPSGTMESSASSPSILKSGSAAIPSIDLLGLRFHAVSLQQALDTIDRFIAEKKPRQISFANAQTVALCRASDDFLNIINHSDLTLADGMSICWGARMLGTRLPERVAGPDLMHALAGRAAQKNYRVFLMGSTRENLEKLQESLKNDWPGLNIVGTNNPSMCERLSSGETDGIIRQIQQAKTDILFVGISCPKQERWIAENLERLNVPVSLGVGAAFDFLSNRIPRAPEWLRKQGLEWLHRLWCEPRRLWKRYLIGNPVFVLLLLKEKFQRKFSSVKIG